MSSSIATIFQDAGLALLLASMVSHADAAALVLDVASAHGVKVSQSELASLIPGTQSNIGEEAWLNTGSGIKSNVALRTSLVYDGNHRDSRHCAC